METTLEVTTPIKTNEKASLTVSAMNKTKDSNSPKPKRLELNLSSVDSFKLLGKLRNNPKIITRIGKLRTRGLNNRQLCEINKRFIDAGVPQHEITEIVSQRQE